MRRDQYQQGDDKAAPGRLRYAIDTARAWPSSLLMLASTLAFGTAGSTRSTVRRRSHMSCEPRRRAAPTGGDFEAMKVAQLKAELAERGSTRTGLKAVLQRRLHALIVQAAREHQAGEMHT